MLSSPDHYCGFRCEHHQTCDCGCFPCAMFRIKHSTEGSPSDTAPSDPPTEPPDRTFVADKDG